jgi:threonyl-tRNA synthetase
MGYKIRHAETSKVPYMLVVGAQEEVEGTVSLRRRREGQSGQVFLSDVIARLKKEISEKAR